MEELHTKIGTIYVERSLPDEVRVLDSDGKFMFWSAGDIKKIIDGLSKIKSAGDLDDFAPPIMWSSSMNELMYDYAEYANEENEICGNEPESMEQIAETLYNWGVNRVGSTYIIIGYCDI